MKGKCCRVLEMITSFPPRECLIGSGKFVIVPVQMSVVALLVLDGFISPCVLHSFSIFNQQVAVNEYGRTLWGTASGSIEFLER